MEQKPLLTHFFIALSIFLSFGCLHYPDDVIRMELPHIEEGDNVIEYTGFTLCYDEKYHLPRWVAYELTAEETSGPYSRTGIPYQQDPSTILLQADRHDYDAPEWSRGHMAPAGDFKWDNQAMKETFFMTNICPQNADLNNGDWKKLEEKVREVALKFGNVYVVMGPVIGKNVYGTIGFHQVVVPDAFYKALLVFDGEQYISIAFLMMNTPEPRHLKDCALSVNDLEKITGIDFFVDLDDSFEEAIEDTKDLKAWKVFLNEKK